MVAKSGQRGPEQVPVTTGHRQIRTVRNTAIQHAISDVNVPHEVHQSTNAP